MSTPCSLWRTVRKTATLRWNILKTLRIHNLMMTSKGHHPKLDRNCHLPGEAQNHRRSGASVATVGACHRTLKMFAVKNGIILSSISYLAPSKSKIYVWHSVICHEKSTLHDKAVDKKVVVSTKILPRWQFSSRKRKVYSFLSSVSLSRSHGIFPFFFSFPFVVTGVSSCLLISRKVS